MATLSNQSFNPEYYEKAFELHDTYGFPIDLTLEMAQEAGLEVDMDGFNEAIRLLST